mmetsp:Transcript_44376/g.53642  ORF Transcript_44376/g.53642 Transcript_44376/m.53642 type:complete len:114 (-) Transcript_44376:207-548(-)|eukprot:CAMPEP_0172481426 /NCGR_PEP_ID=MMETSP1066-20121228/7255_1 /TAXON_ID=671091 /ORGANISM="Coscinodiscus wailesii, Strain CCMP2513" /LENGTH=113 /DNA_ID=CAMNT_0013243683 /DNA_START=130 /DNA_END=471 /DNA_ORIENTATION=-
MPSTPRSKSGTKQKSSRSRKSSSASVSSRESLSSSSAPPSSGFLLSCDPPTKQFIKRLDDTKSVDKKFVIEDLDATHLLVDGKAREEIMSSVEHWMDENVFSNVERVGENLET